MSKEQYVTFEVAKLLKEKGFNWPCTHYYYDDGTMHEALNYVRQNDGEDDDNDECLCPTQQMAMRWLREEKMIFISPFPTFKSSSTFRSIFHYSWSVDIKNCFGEELGGHYEYITYEDAVEAALEYCLTRLI